MTDYLIEDCGSCGAPIIRAVHERTLKASVIDAAAGSVGNVVLVPARNEHAPPLYRIVKVADPPRPHCLLMVAPHD